MCTTYDFLSFVMVHMELHSTVVMYFGSYDIGYAIPSLYHVCMDLNEGFNNKRERERERERKRERSVYSINVEFNEAMI